LPRRQHIPSPRPGRIGCQAPRRAWRPELVDPIARLARLAWTAEGQIAYRRKRPGADGRIELVLPPVASSALAACVLAKVQFDLRTTQAVDSRT